MPLRRIMGRTFLSAFGWKEEGDPPAHAKYVLIAAPHTTNWDFPFTLALSWVTGVRIRWMGKHSLFEGPFGWFFKGVGGVPVIRHEKRNMVQQMIDLFEESDQLVLLVPAEGTRSRRDHWRSGFYHIAQGADVPVVLGYLDFARRRGGFGEGRKMSGDIKADMDRIRAFYADKVGKYPEKFCPPKLREEDPPATASV
ncbi:MAG: lysophospholipid acyltransferase family protein [Myxococcota bacterium]